MGAILTEPVYLSRSENVNPWYKPETAAMTQGRGWHLRQGGVESRQHRILALNGHDTKPSVAPSESAIRLLDELLHTPAGVVIREQLIQLIHEWEGVHAGISAHRAAITEGYALLLAFLLEEYAKDPSSEHILNVSARIIQARQTYRGLLTAPGRPGLEAARGDPDTQAMMSVLREGIAKLARTLTLETAAARQPPAAAVAEGQRAPAEAGLAEAPPRPSAVEQQVNVTYRHHLEQRSNQIEKLQDTLSQKLQQSIDQSRQFGEQLQSALSTLERPDRALSPNQVKQAVMRTVNDLSRRQTALADNLRSTREYLQVVASDSTELRRELDKVRLLSLIDEPTGLSNRRAFLRRLLEEMGRAQRYGIPLTVALIDLDEFKAINDTYGHAVGDRVLRCYAEQVLSVLRRHDMVARYGGEEFAILFPNTDTDGALRALTKVRNQAAETECPVDQMRLPLPTFSAGLTLYSVGEPASRVIERADRAMYRAKRMGRDRIEVGTPPAPSASEPERKNRS